MWVVDNFFVIDSRELNKIETQLIGYVITDDGIYDYSNQAKLDAGKLNGCGTYIYIKREGKKVTIFQDSIGSYGLYLYCKDGYFAISNSDIYLVRYLCSNEKLTLNYEYACELILTGLSGRVYAETIVNEIDLLDRDVRVDIDVDSKTLDIKKVDYGESSIPLDSEEGMNQLDKWFNKWGRMIRGLIRCTDQISMDLSGGFDSRMVLSLALACKADLTRIRINSINDGLHTHNEDYDIASRLAKKFDFELNGYEMDMAAENYSSDKSIELSELTKFTSHKQMRFPVRRHRLKKYIITGCGGEMIRACWNYNRQDYIEGDIGSGDRYSEKVAAEMKDAARRILNRGFDRLYSKEHHGNQVDGILYYKNTGCRTHFGKSCVEVSFSNKLTINPLMDPELLKIQISTDECRDPNLLMAVIFMRFCPELLAYPFEGNREISKDTAIYARMINEKFPFSGYEGGDKNIAVEAIDDEVTISHDKSISWKEQDDKLMLKYDSEEFRELITNHFSSEVYDYAKKYTKSTEFFPLSEVYVLIGIGHIIKYIEGRVRQ